MHPIADIVSSKAAKIRVRFRPIRSVTIPDTTQPAMVPKSADETTHPSMAGLSWNCICKNELHPEITAVSYPKRKPPMVEIKLIT